MTRLRRLRAAPAALLAIACTSSLQAQSWPGWTNQSVRLNTRTFDFGAPGGTNENYYDGDFADFDGDYRMDRAFISRFGLIWNTGDGFLTPVSTQRIDPATGNASGPQDLPSYTGYRFGDGYAGNDAVQWADVDGDGDPDSIQGGNGEPFVLQTKAQDVVVAAADPDSDGDGLTDGMELDGGTDADRPDTDGDGFGDAIDCAPLDGLAGVRPAEITGVRVTGGAAAPLAWDASAADPSLLVYDVAFGSIAGLERFGPAAMPACLARDLASGSATDPAPALPRGTYYLVRAVAGCPRDGSEWGRDSLGRARGSSASCP